jgi:beta-glucosidase
MGTKDSLHVSLTVTNTGKYAGEEVVQLYIHDKVGSVTRPVKELKGFKKILLAPGQAQQVTFTIHAQDLRFYTKNMRFDVEPGEFEVMVGPNSAQVQSQTFMVK